MEWVQTISSEGITWLRQSHPAWLIGALALLPLVGVPVSPLWILCGMRFGPVWGSVIGVATVLVNISAAYGLGACWLRQPLERWLGRRGFKVPQVAAEDERSFILLCRVTPGFPLAMQNYVLGCARVRFSRYLLISGPIVGVFCCLIVLFGDSLAESQAWKTVLTLCLLLALVLIVRLGRRAMRRRARGLGEAMEGRDEGEEEAR